MAEIPPALSYVERGGFLLFLIGISIVLALVVWPFAAPILWAALAAIMFQPLYHWLLRGLRGHANTAAVLTLAIITVAVIFPTIFIGSVIVEQAVGLFAAFRDGDINVADWFGQIKAALPAAMQDALGRSGFGDYAVLQDRAQTFASESLGLIASKALSIGGSVFGWVLSFGLALYVLYFLLRDGQAIGEHIVRAIPMQAPIAERMADRFILVVRATIKGSVVVGLVQGMLGAATFALVGIPSALLLGLLVALASLIPAVGAGLIWVPVAIYLLATGAVWEGLLVVFSGVAIIGMADNVLRPILVGRDTGIPDWLILVTTLGGIATMGLSGIVLGPLAAGLFLTGWIILRDQREASHPVRAGMDRD